MESNKMECNVMRAALKSSSVPVCRIRYKVCEQYVTHQESFKCSSSVTALKVGAEQLGCPPPAYNGS